MPGNQISKRKIGGKEKIRRFKILCRAKFDAVVGCNLDTPGLDQSNRCIGTDHDSELSSPPPSSFSTAPALPPSIWMPLEQAAVSLSLYGSEGWKMLECVPLSSVVSPVGVGNQRPLRGRRVKHKGGLHGPFPQATCFQLDC